MNWFGYSLIGAIGLAIHMLSMTKLAKLQLPTSFINAVVFSGAAIFLIIIYFVGKKEINLQMVHIPWLVIASVSILTVIIVTLEALKLAPNPGFVTAVENLSTILLTVGAVIFLASPLSFVKGLGVLLAFTGVLLISL
ncbi:hypothetical protein DID78_06380 [Candidatus Marinamargulisbacteria bacterium SCGC AG-343-D04]|nr:hypothetical protein DID78_06380 [Candidatus Marinamargulisbacteria bacterium SCGC AG-343-D04]